MLARRGRKHYLPRTLAYQAVLCTICCSLVSAKFQVSGGAPFPAAWLCCPAHHHTVLGVGAKESEIVIFVQPHCPSSNRDFVVSGEGLPATGLSLGCGADPLASLVFKPVRARCQGTWIVTFVQIPAFLLRAPWSYLVASPSSVFC